MKNYELSYSGFLSSFNILNTALAVIDPSHSFVFGFRFFRPPRDFFAAGLNKVKRLRADRSNVLFPMRSSLTIDFF